MCSSDLESLGSFDNVIKSLGRTGHSEEKLKLIQQKYNSKAELERSAILLGCIADALGNAEVFPFERKMPEKFIRELDEYMCR